MSIMHNPCVTAALRELENAGIRNVEVTRGSRHPQLRFQINGGPVRIFTVAGTPSDWRAADNTRSDMRRLLRSAGVIVAPDPRPAPPPRQPSRVELLEKRIAALERAVFSTMPPKEVGKS
jgi:hypothetical protein